MNHECIDFQFECLISGYPGVVIPGGYPGVVIPRWLSRGGYPGVVIPGGYPGGCGYPGVVIPGGYPVVVIPGWLSRGGYPGVVIPGGYPGVVMALLAGPSHFAVFLARETTAGVGYGEMRLFMVRSVSL